jgi:phage terminase small subunit
MKGRRDLTSRQKLFVIAFVSNGGNATEAARQAGFSEKNADKIGPALLGNSRVAAEIAKGRARLAKKLDITAEALIFAAAKVAFADARRLFGPDGRLLPVHLLDDDVVGAIGSVEVRTAADGTERITRIRLSDRNAAQRNLAIMLGMTRPGPDHYPPVGVGGPEDRQKQRTLRELLDKLSPESIAKLKEVAIEAKAAQAKLDGGELIEHDEGDTEPEDRRQPIRRDDAAAPDGRPPMVTRAEDQAIAKARQEPTPPSSSLGALPTKPPKPKAGW